MATFTASPLSLSTTLSTSSSWRQGGVSLNNRSVAARQPELSLARPDVLRHVCRFIPFACDIAASQHTGGLFYDFLMEQNDKLLEKSSGMSDDEN